VIKNLERSYYVGMIILFVGVILALIENPYAIIVYTLGLIPIVGIRIFNFLVSKPENKRRNLIMVLSGAALTMAGVGIYLHESWWIVFLAISAVLDFYISFRRFQ
jgi:uncharacterized membrane protein YczE